MWYQNICHAMHRLVLSQSTRVTDGQTDVQNYDSQDRASIAASRGKNRLYVRNYLCVQCTPRHSTANLVIVGHKAQ